MNKFTFFPWVNQLPYLQGNTMFYYHEKNVTWVNYQTEQIYKSVVNNFSKNNIGYAYFEYN